MSRRTLYLAALIVETVLMGCAAALLAVSEKAEAAFPGKNGHIAYVRNDGQDHEIYAINGGGEGKVQLTHNATGDYEPSYSPNGKKIVYSGSSGSSDTEIYTINAGGGGKTRLTRNDRDEFDPAYSPDGKKIVYMHDGTNDSELYTIDLRTGHRVQLTRNDRDDFNPAFSPDGKRIVYSGSNRKYDKSAICTISAGGGGRSKVTEGSDPSYSPDGKKIVYTLYKGPFTGIYKIDVGGGGKVRVTPRLEFAESPSWGSRP